MAWCHRRDFPSICIAANLTLALAIVLLREKKCSHLYSHSFTFSLLNFGKSTLVNRVMKVELELVLPLRWYPMFSPSIDLFTHVISTGSQSLRAKIMSHRVAIELSMCILDSSRWRFMDSSSSLIWICCCVLSVILASFDNNDTA